MERPLMIFPALLLCLWALLLQPSGAGAVEGGRERAAALYREAVRLQEEGELERAAALLRDALAADPDYAEAYDRLGYVLLRKGEVEQALRAFRSALEINPRLQSARTGVGFALYRKGELREAEEVLKEALVLNPYPSMTHYVLGLVYEGLKDYDRAIAHYKKGIRKLRSAGR